jgi:hypothetical protein
MVDVPETGTSGFGDKKTKSGVETSIKVTLLSNNFLC